MKSIVICDIDGCLNFYPKTFLDWVKKQTGISKKNISDLKSFLTKVEYEKLKYKYRTCGVKRNLAIRKGVVDAFTEIRKSGKEIWILTTRPTFEPVKKDTRHWLKKNKVIHDRLIFKKMEEKREYLRELRKKILFIIDDDFNIAIYSAEKLKIPVFLFNNNWNDSKQNNKKTYPLITHIKSWHNIKIFFHKYFS